MKKQLTLIVAASVLNGCIMSGPMALLPPTAKFLMWQGDENQTQDDQSSISVEQLLKKARSYAGEEEAVTSVEVAYDDYVITDQRLEALSHFKTTSFEMVCGPYEYGSPLDAAMTALKSCSGIKRELLNHGLDVSVRFDPNGAKGKAILQPLLIKVAEDDA